MNWSAVKQYVMKSHSDAFALLFLVSMVCITFLFEVICVLPYVHTDNAFLKYFHTIMGLFILHNIYGNLALIIKTDTSTTRLLLPSVLLNEWRFCAACESNSPPRSFHCPVCNACILKRDHHCAFAATCIGYFNFRYFYSLLIYVAIGALYSSILNMFFIWDILGGFTFYNLLSHTFPFMFWIFGRLSFKTMFWSMISVIDICGFLFALGLLAYHGSLLIRNQTVFEKNKAIQRYNLFDWKTNVKESLGYNWHLVWISPFISSQLPRNGIHFPSHSEYKLKSNKNK